MEAAGDAEPAGDAEAAGALGAGVQPAGINASIAGPSVLNGSEPPCWSFPSRATVGVWCTPAAWPWAVSAFTAATIAAAPFAMQASYAVRSATTASATEARNAVENLPEFSPVVLWFSNR